jgi:hypothetical protein
MAEATGVMRLYLNRELKAFHGFRLAGGAEAKPRLADFLPGKWARCASFNEASGYS